MEFEKVVLDGVENIGKRVDSIKSQQEQLLGDVGRLSDETKSALADLGKVKENANQVQAQLARIDRALAMEKRLNFRDPVQRFVNHDESREWLCDIVRSRYSGTPLKRTTITGVDSGLGAAVTPQETASMIYDTLLNYGQWSTLGTMPIGSRTQIVPVQSVRPTAYWVAQEVAPTEGAFTGTSVTLTIKEAAAWIPVARANIEDSNVDLAAHVLKNLGQSVAYRLDWACFAADGTDDTTDGAYTGIASGGTAATAANGNTTVGNLQLDDFVRCLTTVDAGILSRPCKWWIHPQILAKICLIRDDNGRPIFQNAMDAPAPGAIGSILGYPVVLTGAMPSTDAAGNVVAVFGDPEAGVVGIRKDFEFAESDHFEFSQNNRAFRAIVRAGFIIRIATGFAKLTTAAA
jgi:HK97 family phage major capsid protein